MINEIFFGYFAVAIIALSLVVITRRNPVHSVLFMLLLFFHIAALYLFLNAEFLAAIQIIVYAGAILVLFLFVVFLLNLREELAEKKYIALWPAGALLAAAFFITVSLSLQSFEIGPAGPYSVEAIASEGNVTALGRALYTEYLFPFEIASLVLLVAIVGAIVLAKKHLKT